MQADVSVRLCPPGWSPEQTVLFLKGLVAAEPGMLAGCLAATPLGAEGADWLQRQRLAPYAFHRLREMHLLPQLPEAVQAALRLAYYGALTQYTWLSVELDTLLAEFRKRGIEPIVLKGMAVCSTAYPSPATRPTSDLDVLIERSQMEASRRLLTARGYRDKGLDQGQHTAFAHHLHMWRESLGGHHMVVEVHWELVHDPGYARRMDVWGFMARAQRMDSPDGVALVLDPTDQLIHASAHLLLHHPQEWSLLWLLDLRLLVARWGAGWDWSELVGRAERYKLAGALRYWLELAEAWYGPFLPPQAVQALAAAHMFPEEHWYIATARARYARQWEFVWRKAWDAPNLVQALTFFRQTLFPPWAYMQYRYGARSRWLAPLYYGWRFIRAGLVAFRRVGLG
jgi:hypothetical protein